MPYINTRRAGVAPTTDYLTWPDAMATGLEQLVGEALDQPGAVSVELVDDARSRVLFVQRDRAGVAVRPVGVSDDGS